MVILLVLALYFSALVVVGRWAGGRSTNQTFFRGERRSPWQMVAFGMIGASVSGVTFVSVPGMVITSDMTYLQTCLGFILGYAAVAWLLLPVYYSKGLTTIYSYLNERLGPRSYQSSVWFFLLSKLAGTVIKFYLFVAIAAPLLPWPAGLSPSWRVACAAVFSGVLLWLYTRRGGIRTLVFTDTVQTTCMLVALLVIIGQVLTQLHLSPWQAVQAVWADSHSRVFDFSDWHSRTYFWKQFLSGVFIVIVMTGLDQDMMQKNLTCRSLQEAQKDMVSYGTAFVPVNLLFLSLGVLLLLLAAGSATGVVERGDELLPMFAATGRLGLTAVVMFLLGLTAASFSTADSALTSLTTILCVDIVRRPADEHLRRRVHGSVCLLLVVLVWLFSQVGTKSLIDTVYTLVGYTYGPLLGLFAFGLLTHRAVRDRAVPFVCVASPLLCWLAESLSARLLGYHFGYELLMLNGLLTFAGLWLTAKRGAAPAIHS